MTAQSGSHSETMITITLSQSLPITHLPLSLKTSVTSTWRKLSWKTLPGVNSSETGYGKCMKGKNPEQIECAWRCCLKSDYAYRASFRFADWARNTRNRHGETFCNDPLLTFRSLQICACRAASSTVYHCQRQTHHRYDCLNFSVCGTGLIVCSKRSSEAKKSRKNVGAWVWLCAKLIE